MNDPKPNDPNQQIDKSTNQQIPSTRPPLRSAAPTDAGRGRSWPTYCGRTVPPERIEDVVHHYASAGARQDRATMKQAAALRALLASARAVLAGIRRHAQLGSVPARYARGE
jgi:hypothetical protein